MSVSLCSRNPVNLWAPDIQETGTRPAPPPLPPSHTTSPPSAFATCLIPAPPSAVHGATRVQGRCSGSSPSTSRPRASGWEGAGVRDAHGLRLPHHRPQRRRRAGGADPAGVLPEGPGEALWHGNRSAEQGAARRRGRCGMGTGQRNKVRRAGGGFVAWEPVSESRCGAQAAVMRSCCRAPHSRRQPMRRAAAPLDPPAKGVDSRVGGRGVCCARCCPVAGCGVGSERGGLPACLPAWPSALCEALVHACMLSMGTAPPVVQAATGHTVLCV